MATVNADTLNNVLHAGTYGNNARHHTKVADASGVAQNDAVRMAKLPKCAKVADLHVIFGAFGAARTIDVGYTPVDSASALTPDPDYWTTSPIDVSAAGNFRTDQAPISFDEDVYVIATLAGGAGAAVGLHALIDSEFVGNL